MTSAVPLESETLADLPGLRHGFFTRRGGVSTGIYASLNCGLGSGDDLAAVRENRSRAMAAFGLGEAALATAYQVHSAEVLVIEKPWDVDQHPKVDGLVTREPGIAVGVLAADCTPILFAEPKARVVAAAHAGWRGALSGVIEATVAAMLSLGAALNEIRAAIGPTIAQPSYEVGPEFPGAFLAEDARNAAFFAQSARDGHFMFDLPGYAAMELERLGVASIDRLARDTYAEPELFFSYRRNTHQGIKDYGRGLSAIALL